MVKINTGFKLVNTILYYIKHKVIETFSSLIQDLYIVLALHQIAIENNTAVRLQFNELLLDCFYYKFLYSFNSFNKQRHKL